jgi:hypothetical protein
MCCQNDCSLENDNFCETHRAITGGSERLRTVSLVFGLEPLFLQTGALANESGQPASSLGSDSVFWT